MFPKREKKHKNFPLHIAMIMDGNGRYAKSNNKPRIFGHKKGMNNVKTIATYASKIGVQYLTLYAFSTENWTRPNSEVKFLMQLPIDFLSNFLPDLMEHNIKVETIGYIEKLPLNTQQAVINAVKETENNTGMTLIFALNYGSHDEITSAIKNIANHVQTRELSIEQIDSNTISNYMMTSSYPDPDMIIRTSGEYRLSNFLLWQAAYSEFFFTDTLWPVFTTEELQNMIDQYQYRDRRYGGLNERED